jgi:hypothetical protein
VDLNIARNPAVDDDAVSGLLMLTKLTYLSAADTSIGMPGARRLVKDKMLGDGERTLIDLPHLCHEYIEGNFLFSVLILTHQRTARH